LSHQAIAIPTVVLDAQPLSSVAAGGGIATYTRNLLSALAERRDVKLLALCDPLIPLPPGVDHLPLRRLAARPRAQVVEHSLRLPFDLWRGRPAGSVFHNPSYHAPLGVRSPWVQTLHDVIPLVFDSPDQAALRARWQRFGPRYRKADAVIAISRHAATEGVRLLGLDPDRVHVALHGVDTRFHPRPPDSSEPPYLLTVSEFSRRKGFAEAFAVMDALADAGYPHHLIVAGRVHRWGQEELASLHASATHPERIELRGFVPDLVPLFQGAAAFLMTSRYEGFGLPALEAMACGAPVIAFANSSITEVVGGGGQLVEDGNVPAMTSAIRRVLDNPAFAEEQREQGLRHASSFTWQRTASIHADVYRSIADARR
jgi:glycosyltransferase involved in cell wall biosynthesis